MINEKKQTELSKFLSLVLRHKPETIGLELDPEGWADVKELFEKMNAHRKPIDMEVLEVIVENNNKKRFRFNEDKTRIRASQGHSISIDLGYEKIEPPEVLYHGTASKNIDNILKTGLTKGSRHHVHLSLDIETAINVGQRHGKPVVLNIRARAMHNDGLHFYRSDNGVWLTESVPVQYILMENNE
ncbi:RNA 2'-phosphotransferase [Fulvivirga sp. 29W222]|uniref:Probable RNA 2'-phosphotransferase n=1 Tax=Fulvivirga marina TaxID=2494733 RepID=A0A937KC85_9BACT|nr:RNA 2'-phosphotransferase [Fulvivirga marina]MBL6447901.1 RNA 2'-phosphotransferase [Fulvivirga marina]